MTLRCWVHGSRHMHIHPTRRNPPLHRCDNIVTRGSVFRPSISLGLKYCPRRFLPRHSCCPSDRQIAFHSYIKTGQTVILIAVPNRNKIYTHEHEQFCARARACVCVCLSTTPKRMYENGDKDPRILNPSNKWR
jgi:hypothetical protein